VVSVFCGEICVITMAYAPEHMFSLPVDIPPRPIYKFSIVSVNGFSTGVVSVFCGETCVITMAYAPEHMFSLPVDIPLRPVYKFSIVSVNGFSTGVVPVFCGFPQPCLASDN